MTKFGEAIYGEKRRKTNRPRGEKAGRVNIVATAKANRTTLAYQTALANARSEAEREAQHGPVKVLWKDGRPV